VVGLDFSEPAVDAANALARETGLDGRFVAADVYEAAKALGGERFEILYTGLGALNWLPDVGAWARVVASLLAEGGFLYLAEFHPITWALGDEEIVFERDYFHVAAGQEFDEPGTYAELDAETDHNVTREWNHTLADVIEAILAAGLRLDLFREHDFTLFERWPMLERAGGLEAGEIYRLPPGTPNLPLMYSLRARR
jgi:SAM-dependent methyltransferase